MMKGTADFFGLNHYTSSMCENSNHSENSIEDDWNYWTDREIHTYKKDSWVKGKLFHECLVYLILGTLLCSWFAHDVISSH